MLQRIDDSWCRACGIRDSSRCLPRNWYHSQASVEKSLDAARTSARATPEADTLSYFQGHSMKADRRELRQLADNFLRAHKDREFTLRQIALAIGAPNTQELLAALASEIRCPFTSCQSIDTALPVQVDNAAY